jgi:hypothetical protein
MSTTNGIDNEDGTTLPEGTVGQFWKNSRETVYARIYWFEGHQLASLRAYVPDEEGGWRPTRKGLDVSVDALPDLAEAVAALQAAVDRERQG